MKTTAEELTKAYISDNREYIDGNVAEHLKLCLNQDSDYCEYLSDDEIDEYFEANLDKKQEIREEIENWIDENFDFDISDLDD